MRRHVPFRQILPRVRLECMWHHLHQRRKKRPLPLRQTGQSVQPAPVQPSWRMVKPVAKPLLKLRQNRPKRPPLPKPKPRVKNVPADLYPQLQKSIGHKVRRVLKTPKPSYKPNHNALVGQGKPKVKARNKKARGTQHLKNALKFPPHSGRVYKRAPKLKQARVSTRHPKHRRKKQP